MVIKESNNDFKALTLRQQLREYSPEISEKGLDVDYIEILYEQYKNPLSTDEEKNFAINTLMAAFLSLYNTQKYCNSNKTNVSVINNEDLDICIASTVFNCVLKYKSDGGTEKDNFLRYCIGSIQKEMYKEHKVSLPFYMPHTTKKQKEVLLSQSKEMAVERDENGMVVYGPDGKPVYVRKRKVAKLRDGTKVNITLDGKYIDTKTAELMPDEEFEMEAVYDDNKYFGPSTFSLSMSSNDNNSETRVNSHSVDYDVTESLVSSQQSGYENLHSKVWETQMMNEDLKEKVLEMEHGNIVAARFGLDRGYPRTVRETADEFNVSTKFVNYWVENCKKTFAAKYPDYFDEYFSA